MTIEKHIIKKKDVKNKPTKKFINIVPVLEHHKEDFFKRIGAKPEVHILSRGNGIFNIKLSAVMGNKVVRESYLYKRTELMKGKHREYIRI